MPKKYYSVKNGHQPGVYETWEECKDQVHGFSGASFKSFPTRKEAELFCGLVAGEGSACEAAPGVESACGVAPEGGSAGERTWILAEQKDEKAVDSKYLQTSETEAVAYVDGSYDDSIKAFAYGVVLFHNGREEHFSAKMDDPELVEMRNVAGEIKAAEAAMQYCIDHNIKSIHIYHDYEGIAKWCTGEWRANKIGTKAYRAFYQRIQTQLQVRFIKVKGHSGDQYNDVADQLAKSALDIGKQSKSKVKGKVKRKAKGKDKGES